MPVAPGQLHLPAALLTRLKEAAEMHHVTEVKKCLDQLETQGPEGRRLALHLRAQVQNFDLEGVLRVLVEVGHE